MFKKLSRILVGTLLVSMFSIPVIGKDSVKTSGSSYTIMADWPTGIN